MYTRDRECPLCFFITSDLTTAMYATCLRIYAGDVRRKFADCCPRFSLTDFDQAELAALRSDLAHVSDPAALDGVDSGRRWPVEIATPRSMTKGRSHVAGSPRPNEPVR